MNGAATIDNSTDLNLLDGTTKGLLDVTADGTITLPGSNVTAGAVALTADEIIVDGETQVTATKDDIEFYAPITGAGKLTAAANDMVHFYETVTQNGEEDDTRLDLDVRADKAEFLGEVIGGIIDVSGDELYIEADITGMELIDIAGVRFTTIGNDITLTADRIYHGDMASLQLEPNDEFLYGVTLKGGIAEDFGDDSAYGIFSAGNITAKDITLDGDIHLLNDVAYIAVGGDVIVGSEDGRSVTSGSRELKVKGENITVNGSMSTGSLAMDAAGDVEFTTKYASLVTDREIEVRALGNIKLASFTTGGGDILISGGSVDLTETTSITGDINVQSDSDLTAARKVTAKRGSVSIDALGDLSVQTEVTAYRDINLSGANVSNGPAILKTTVGDITINATNGNIDFTNEDSEITAGSGRYFLTATDDIAVNAITTAIADSKITAGHNIDLATKSGNSIINTTITTTGEGTATITATDADLNGVSGDFAGNAILKAVEIDNTGVTAVKNLEAVAEYIVNSNLISVEGNVKVEAATITESVIMTKSAEDTMLDVTATAEIDGVTLSAAGDLQVAADYIVGSTLISEEGDVSAYADTMIDATDMLAKNGSVTARSATIYNSTLTAGDGNATATAEVINAATLIATDEAFLTADKIDEATATAQKVTVEADNATVTTIAPEVVVTDSGDVSIIDKYADDVTTVTATATETLTLTSVGDVEGTVEADTFIIMGAQNATFETTVINASVNGVLGTATIANSTDLNLLSGDTQGYLDITADGVIAMTDADVTAGDIMLTADEIIVNGDTQITAALNNAEFFAPITGAGKLTVAANNTARFNETVTQNGEEDDTRMDIDVRADKAEFLGEVNGGIIDVSADELFLQADVTGIELIDIAGVRFTTIGNDITLTAERIYHGDMASLQLRPTMTTRPNTASSPPAASPRRTSPSTATSTCSTT